MVAISMTGMLEKWHGSASILPGIGVFVGRSGHNAEHRHWAQQISIALEGEILVSAGKTRIQGKAIFIPANTLHVLHPSLTLTIYLDPNTLLAKSMAGNLDNSNTISQMNDSVTSQITDCFNNIKTLKTGSQALQQTFIQAIAPGPNYRLSKVLSSLDDILAGQTVTRAQLAEQICLSPSRFSHWFKEETGMSLRSYKKWLHLIYGIDLVLNDKKIQTAAYTANFSDQAHFARTFKQAFGLSPALALANIKRA